MEMTLKSVGTMTETRIDLVLGSVACWNKSVTAFNKSSKRLYCVFVGSIQKAVFLCDFFFFWERNPQQLEIYGVLCAYVLFIVLISLLIHNLKQ